LNDRHNPLEAGLRQAISFDKGCYVGQEVIARLNTYGKVSRKLVGLSLPAGSPLPSRGAELFAEGRAVGRVTSAVEPAGWPHPVGLAYVGSRTAAREVQLRAGGHEIDAVLVELPFPDQPLR
jgi:folate-binding protein YgfZ